MTIVGDGPDKNYIKETSSKYGLHNVSFLGNQDPKIYYQRASIFMMTSSYEGWPMTLNEAKQNALVPLAFDSFKSLSEIIKDQENGFIIEPYDYNQYAKRLIKLMRDENYRERIAEKALIDSKRFALPIIMKKWVALFNSIKS